MSGFEIAGLVLAIAPLLMARIRKYQEEVDTIERIASSKKGDEALEAFIHDLNFELNELKMHIERLIGDLPFLSTEYKQNLIQDLDPKSWESQELAQALSTRLGPGKDTLFIQGIPKILETVEALIGDVDSFVVHSDVNSQGTFTTKLNSIRQNRPSGTSTIYTRFCFNLLHKRKRAEKLEKITKYNEKLFRLLQTLSTAPAYIPTPTPAAIPKKPSLLMRRISQDLHEAIARYWKCNCERGHEDKLYDAKICPTLEPNFSSSMLSFSLIFSSTRSWQECIINVMPSSCNNTNTTAATPTQQISSICSLVEEARGCSICLSILLDNASIPSKLMKGRSQAQRFAAGNAEFVSLEGILRGRMSRKNKLILAATLANIMFQLSEGPWMKQRWNKSGISFIASPRGIDFKRPYLSTEFSAHSVLPLPAPLPTNLNSIHPDPSLLAFGILLLEIELGHALELTSPDLTNGCIPNANSELTAAQRLLQQNIDEIYVDYWRAIHACLEPKFISEHEFGELNKESVREAIYQQIVEPLEAVYHHGFKEKIDWF